MTQLQLLTTTPPTPPENIQLHCCDIAELLAAGLPVPPRIVFADPPWQYANKGDKTRSAAAHYSCLPMQSIVAHLRAAHDAAAHDAYLVLWATFPLLAELMAAATEEAISWRYLTGGAWAKTGAPGAGYHWRGNAEPVLVCRKNKPKPVTTELLRSTHVTEQHRGRARSGDALSHSEKPLSWQRNMIRVWSHPGDTVLDLYAGLGSVARATRAESRLYVGAELCPERHRQALDRLALQHIED